MGEKFNFNTRVLIYPAIFVILFLSYMNNKVFFFNIISFSPNKTNDQNENNVVCRQDCFYNSTELDSNNNHTTVLSGEQKYRIMNKGKYPQARRIEEGLARARAAIRNAAKSRTYTSFKEKSFVPRGSVYHNPYAFHQSHIEMKKRFRVWAYKEGEPPIFHMGPMNDIYSTEGNFMNEFQNESSPFLARSMDEAHAFLIPVSVVSIIKYVYRPYVDYSRERLQNIVQDYIMFVSQKYPYWNRSSGADHFLVSCHDWAPEVSFGHPSLFSNFIRVLCNANSSEGFKPDRDVSLPEIKHEKGLSGLPNPNLALSPRDRKILAFFSGGPHGSVRPELFKHWKDKNDTEIRVYEYLPETLSYKEMMGKSKFCLCPSGFEVASPRIVESIYGGCVPVIISPSYVLPFSDVLDWSKFSVQVPVEKIPELKSILSGISEAKYLEMQKRVVQVQRHFVINQPPEPFDFMHMVMHSLWLRRLNLRV